MKFVHAIICASLCGAFVLGNAGRAPLRAETAPEKQDKTVAYDVHDGYFVSNKFEPNEASSFVALCDQKSFDSVFGAGFVMRDKSHRLPKNAFAKSNVVAVIHRGKALVTYKVENVVQKGDTLLLRYTTKSQATPTAEFASPLILSVAKGTYKYVQFIENDKEVKKVPVPSLTIRSGGHKDEG